MDGTVLVADDDRTIRTVLTQALTRAGCKVHATSSLMTLMRWVDEGKGDLVISDVIMPDGNGLENLPLIQEKRPGMPVIVISAQNTIMTAIKANEAEAYDYLPKPFDLPDLMKRAARALDTKQKTSRSTAREPETTADDLPLIGRTAQMQALYRLIARILNADLSVLIAGESGTGKSLIGRVIHDFSDRRSLPFVRVTASDLTSVDSPAMILSKARGGSILLEEISDLDDEAQGRVVRMIDNLGENAPRIMATSQRDLREETDAGRMRADLFYRLNGVSIEVPSLRERVEDIPLLAEYFLARIEREGAQLRKLSDGALELARSYSWPGNVRQLENIIRRLVATSVETEIQKSEMNMALGDQPALDPQGIGAGDGKLAASVQAHLQRYFDLHGGVLPPSGLYQRILNEIEVPLIEIALDATAGNQAKCADLLGINRNTLRKKIVELDIRVTRRRKLM